MHWTMSINIYDNGENLRYSIRMWRVGYQHRSNAKPDLKWAGTTSRPLSENPTDWRRAVLQRLLEQ